MDENNNTPETPQAKLPENPALKAAETETPASAIPTLPKAGTAETVAPKVGPRPTIELPKAKAPQISFAPKAAPIPPQPIATASDEPSKVSVAIDFVAAAVAVAFAVMIALDI